MQKKKRSVVIFLVLAMVLSIVASAAPAPRYNTTISCNSAISFSGTTATCSLNVKALNGTELSATMSLYRLDSSGETLLKSWSVQSGTTSLNYSDTYTVSKGYTYKVIVDVTANGPGGCDSITKTATATC